MSKQLEIMIIHERPVHSVMSDLATFGTLCATVGVGVYLHSDALQWVAGIVWIFWLITKGVGNLGKSPRMTIAQARDRLDELDRKFQQ